MNWRIIVRPEVERDVAEAAAWYDSQQPGLGIIPSGGFRHVAFDFRANDDALVHFWERSRRFISSSGTDEAGFFL